ncbi:hypothetical protein OI25_4511 [Paraburkholderia fungorum]|uniref:Uncharacterized protein n=1 Tax=Paraburkholderia fungorum TaxID=134537 RepID=A0AAU8T8P2_9BURK|nr:hypothetical protein OI25_4511 [Paraburkholderia fungorum]
MSIRIHSKRAGVRHEGVRRRVPRCAAPFTDKQEQTDWRLEIS